MHLLMDALSCTNLSGRQVLCGHLSELLRAMPDGRITLLLHAANHDVLDLLRTECGADLPPFLTVCLAPSATAHWTGRSVYERLRLPPLIRHRGVDLCLTFSGGWIPGLPCRQMTLALNPWALINTGPRSRSERVKAVLQRRSYRSAVRRADGIGFGSAYMRHLYRANAGATERRGEIVYPALATGDLALMERVRARVRTRDPWTVLCVSLMAPHKDIETLIEAIGLARAAGCPATLRLVGGWSHTGYRVRIERLIADLRLDSAVTIEGHLLRPALVEAYRRSLVYALLSRSESFGIPAVEAQRMGTPVVAARDCAAPEVCGEGGRYVSAGDAPAAARTLIALLTDADEWQSVSAAAEINARRFEYARTTRPLLAMLGIKPKE